MAATLRNQELGAKLTNSCHDLGSKEPHGVNLPITPRQCFKPGSGNSVRKAVTPWQLPNQKAGHILLAVSYTLKVTDSPWLS